MRAEHVDVAIIGGAVMGSATAFFLSNNSDFTGRILVVEKDATYANAASSRSTSGFRQQFSTPVNVSLSRYSAEFIKHAGDHLDLLGEPAGVPVTEAGYLYLGHPDQVAGFEANHAVHRSLGVDVALLEPSELSRRFPWLDTEGVAIGSLGLSGEGWFDGYLLMSAFRRRAVRQGVVYRQAEVLWARRFDDGRFRLDLSDGSALTADRLVNTAGTSAAAVSAMLGAALPIAPWKQSVFSFRSPAGCAAMPYLFTPEGVFCRPDGEDFIAGLAIGSESEAATPEDMELDHVLFEGELWPKLARRVPGFEQLRLKGGWAGHYDMSLLDHNPFIGGVPGLPGYYLAAGFSGHGIMQSPGVGRALSELIIHGRYVTLDLSDLGYERIVRDEPMRETIQY